MAIPVIGAALVIVGGTVAPRGAKQLLGARTIRLVRKVLVRPLSLSLADPDHRRRAGRQTTLPLRENLGLLLLAVVISIASYAIVENPIRHWKVPSGISVGAGVATVAATVAILSLIIEIQSPPGADKEVSAAPDVQAVLHQVAEARSITKVPASIDPALAQAASDWSGGVEGVGCAPGLYSPRSTSASSAMYTLIAC